MWWVRVIVVNNVRFSDYDLTENATMAIIVS
jgi:hypothetical protein